MKDRPWVVFWYDNRKLIRIARTLMTMVLFVFAKTSIAQLAPRPIVRLPVQLRESSGIKVSQPNRLWSLNDSGNTNQIFSFDTTGNILRTVTVSNVQNIDWEDITADNQGNIYINDAGNNDNTRQNLAIHILPNPDLNSSNEQQAQSIVFNFPDQSAFPPPGNNRNFDIEAIVYRTDSLFLFTKNRSSPTNGFCKMYSLKASAGKQTAMLRDSVFTGFTSDDRVTSASLSPDGNMLVLLTRKGLIAFDQYQGNMFFRGRKFFLPFQSMPGQAEGIDFVDSNTLFMTEEGSGGQGGFLYEIKLPQTLSINDLPKPHFGCRAIKQRLIFDAPTNPNDRVEIYDQTGRLLFQSYTSEIVNLSMLKSGVYNIVIVSQQQIRSCRILFTGAD